MIDSNSPSAASTPLPRITAPPRTHVNPTVVFESLFRTQEADAFRMKAIRLLKDHGIYHSVQEIIASLKSAPLKTQIDPDNRKITLSQELCLSPGKYVQLKGSFERRSDRTIPIAESFVIEKSAFLTNN